MEYNEIPTAIKNLKAENDQCNYAIKHDLPRYEDKRRGKIKVAIGDRLVYIDSAALNTLLVNQVSENNLEIERLEDIHETLTKVAVGLINK